MTPFPLFTKLLNASSFSFLALAVLLFFPPRFDTYDLTASVAFFRFFRSLERAARFSAGVSSERSRNADRDLAGARSSSGARRVEVAEAVGNADSRFAVATFEMDEIAAVGCVLHIIKW